MIKTSIKKVIFLILAFLSFFILSAFTNRNSDNNKNKISSETEMCIECHKIYTPGIVTSWEQSRHSKTTPSEGLQKQKLERRISNDNIEENLLNNIVGCYECHSLNKNNHKDNFEHNGFDINVIVSPEDCKTCHLNEVNEYNISKKSYAYHNLESNPIYSLLVNTIISNKTFKNDIIENTKPSDETRSVTCFGCHGLEIVVNGSKKIETKLGDMEIPNLKNWPNQGVGRINPDGSRGSCTACHPRHSFSIEIARKPYTCAQCHLEPDVPAWEVYKESKHGNIFSSNESKYNWDSVPIKAGVDFPTPTCAYCHNSLIVNNENEIIANRSHDFGARLWVRIFGLIYTHPQPKTGKTFEIINKDKLPLPATFNNEIAKEYLIDSLEINKRKELMASICNNCHSSTWTKNHFAKFDITNYETDNLIKTSTKLMQKIWDKKIQNNKNPFDETIEQEWIKGWLFYANSIRYSVAMTGSYDYASFKNGWWNLTNNIGLLKEKLELKK